MNINFFSVQKPTKFYALKLRAYFVSISLIDRLRLYFINFIKKSEATKRICVMF